MAIDTALVIDMTNHKHHKTCFRTLLYTQTIVMYGPVSFCAVIVIICYTGGTQFFISCQCHRG